MVRLRKLVSARKLTREEVSGDDQLFLQRYYHHNKQNFKLGRALSVGLCRRRLRQHQRQAAGNNPGNAAFL